jgi:hypothetical protein
MLHELSIESIGTTATAVKVPLTLPAPTIPICAQLVVLVLYAAPAKFGARTGFLKALGKRLESMSLTPHRYARFEDELCTKHSAFNHLRDRLHVRMRRSWLVSQRALETYRMLSAYED